MQISGFLRQSPQRLPTPSIMYPGYAGFPENGCRLPAMSTGAAAKNNGFIQGPYPPDIGPDTVHRYIQGMRNMSLIKFVWGPEIDDHPSLPQSLSDLSASSENF